ncbi:MAG: hypothetical protein LBH03_00455 [Holophagales bacterium]|jgi:hypothetical protein|nr:hypothetical protein [Holophagales bacterium]
MIVPVIFSAVSLTAPMTAQTVLHGSHCILWHFGETSDQLYKGLQALLRTEELVEMGLGFATIQKTGPEYAHHLRERNLGPGSTWALYFYGADRRIRCLLKGSKLPTVADIKNSLDQAGIRSPIRVLRDFLRQHPDHLDARMHFLERLRKMAVIRTQRALQLEPKINKRLHYPTSLTVDTDTLGDKKLDPESDISIWGSYAQELQTLYEKCGYCRRNRYSRHKSS